MARSKKKALAAIKGLTLADAIQFFDARATKRDKQIAEMVKIEDGDFECDNSIISEGTDNGAYVLGWRWVDFADTEFDKDNETGEPNAA